MALSEYESRVLRDIEDSLHDVERRCAVIKRRMQRRHGRRPWLITLCVLAPIIGAGLIALGAMAHHDGIAIAVLGSAMLAIPCVGVSPLCNQRRWKSVELPNASSGSGTSVG